MSTVIGFPTDDVLNGTEFNDTLEGRGGHDTLHGLAGNDYLIGDYEESAFTGNGVFINNLGGTSGFGENSLAANEPGDDYLDGGPGRDTMIGGLGNETYIVNDAGD